MNSSSLRLFVIAVLNALLIVTAVPLNKSEPKTSVGNKLECDSCNFVLPIVRLLLKNNQTTYLDFICIKLKIEDQTVCTEILELYKVENEAIYCLNIVIGA